MSGRGSFSNLNSGNNSKPNNEKQWIKGLTEDERFVLNSYSFGGYWVNDELRKGENDPNDETIKLMDKAISKFELNKDIKVYRNSSADLVNGYTTAEEINKNLKGKTVKDLGYMSTSTDKSVSSATDESGAGLYGDISYEIKVSKGKGKGAFISGISGAPGESEFLLKRGTKFKVLGARTEKGKTIVSLSC